MIAGAWLCLVAPLAGALLITLAGTHISRSAAAWISTGSVFVGFAGALVAFIQIAGESPDERSHLSTAYTWLGIGQFEVAMQILVDPVSLVMMMIITGVGGLIVWYSVGYMKGEDEERRYFAYMALFVFSMLMLVMGGNLLLLLVGWGLVGLASYLLIGFYHDRPEAVAAAKKAFIMNAIGDAAMALGVLPADLEDRHSRLLGELRRRLERRALVEHTEPRRPRAPRRRDRKVRPAAAAHLAPGRDGRPDARLRPDPRGNDGDGRRLPDRPHPRDLRGRPERPAPRGDHRRSHDHRRRRDRSRAMGHQARDRVLDDVADRLHVPRGRDRLVRLRHVPSVHARVLQGTALPRRRRDHPPPRRRAGHAQDGWPQEPDAVHARGVPDRRPRACRDPAALGLLVEGRHHLGGSGRRGRARLHAVRSRAGRRTAHRRLHLQALLPRLPRRAVRARPRARRRSRLGHAHGTESAHGHGEHAHGEGPLSMLIPVGVLAVLSAVAGLLVIPGVWEPFLDWIDGVAEPLVVATVAQDYATSAVAVTLAGIGIWLARRAYLAGRELVADGGVRRVAGAQALFRRALRRGVLAPVPARRESSPREGRGAGRPGLPR